jgi:hypothetical protein
MVPSACATSRQPLERRGCGFHIFGIRGRRKGHCRSDHQTRVAIVQMRPHQAGGLLPTNRRQRAHGRRTHFRCVVLQHALDAWSPALPQLERRPLDDAQRSRPHFRRIVIEEQRADQLPLVQRFEHVNRVDHVAWAGMALLLDQRFNRREIGFVQPHRVGRDHLLVERSAEDQTVLAASTNRRQYPETDHRQARPAELLPAQAQSDAEAEDLILDEEEHQQRPDALREPIDGDVDERLRLLLQLVGQRQEQNLARGLVNGVAQRRVDDSGERRRPQGTVQEHDRAGDAEARWQNQECEADAEIPLDFAREPHLDDESDHRRVKLHGAEEARD